MGTNRRYAAQVDARMDARVAQSVSAGGPLQSLSDLELQLDQVPFTRDPQPKSVKAWVRFGAVPLMVDAVACSWTPYAVAIRFEVAGVEYRTWVWASAVRGGDC